MWRFPEMEKLEVIEILSFRQKTLLLKVNQDNLFTKFCFPWYNIHILFLKSLDLKVFTLRIVFLSRSQENKINFHGNLGIFEIKKYDEKLTKI